MLNKSKPMGLAKKSLLQEKNFISENLRLLKKKNKR